MYYQCNTMNKETCHAIVELARVNGWGGSMITTPVNADTYFWVSCYVDSLSMHGNEVEKYGRTPVSIPELIKIIVDKPKPKRLDFTIGGAFVFVYSSGIIFINGEQITRDQLETLLKELDN